MYYITSVLLSTFLSLMCSDGIGPRSKGGVPMGSVMEGDTRKLEEAVGKGEGRTTLKMKRDGQAVVEQVVCMYVCMYVCAYSKLLYGHVMIM